MVPVHDYVKRYAEAFAITQIRTFKHEPFFIVGGGGGGGLFVVLYGTCASTSVLWVSLSSVQVNGH